MKPSHRGDGDGYVPTEQDELFAWLGKCGVDIGGSDRMALRCFTVTCDACDATLFPPPLGEGAGSGAGKMEAGEAKWRWWSEVLRVGSFDLCDSCVEMTRAEGMELPPEMRHVDAASFIRRLLGLPAPMHPPEATTNLNPSECDGPQERSGQ